MTDEDGSGFSNAVLICPVCGFNNPVDVPIAIKLVYEKDRGSYTTPSDIEDPKTLNVYGKSDPLKTSLVTCRNCDSGIV